MKVALYRERTLLGAAIRWQTRGRYNHAAIWLGEEVWEATMPKVRVRPFNDQDKRADVFEVLGVVEEALVESFLCAQLGKPYDLSSVIRFVSRRQESRKRKGHWFCSELVFAALPEGGITLFPNTEPWEVSPALLIRSPFLRKTKNPLAP